jgi:hypothetical protein
VRHTILAIAVLSVAALSTLPAQAGLFGRLPYQPYKPSNPHPSAAHNNLAAPPGSQYCNSLLQRCGFHYRIVKGKDFQ